MTEINIAKLLGARIKALRKGMNLKRAEFARLVEMSEDAIGLIERGETSPRLENLYKMAAKLNMPLAKLINFDKEINQRSIKALRPLLTESQLYLKTKLPNQIRKIRDIAQNIFNNTTPSQKKRHILIASVYVLSPVTHTLPAIPLFKRFIKRCFLKLASRDRPLISFPLDYTIRYIYNVIP